MRSVWLLVLVACTTTTPDPPTGQLSGQLAADLRDGSLVVSLQIHDDDEDDEPNYALAPGESIHATFRGHTVALDAAGSGSDAGTYTTTLSPDPPVVADEPIVVTFDRGGDDVVKLTATTTAELTLQAPASSPQPVTLTWSPTAADRIRWDSTSFTVPAADGAIETDTGEITFPPKVLSRVQPEGVTIDVARSRSASPHTAFGKTSVAFNRWHTVMVEVTP